MEVDWLNGCTSEKTDEKELVELLSGLQLRAKELRSEIDILSQEVTDSLPL
jgi:hypothetical protein